MFDNEAWERELLQEHAIFVVQLSPSEYEKIATGFQDRLIVNFSNDKSPVIGDYLKCMHCVGGVSSGPLYMKIKSFETLTEMPTARVVFLHARNNPFVGIFGPAKAGGSGYIRRPSDDDDMDRACRELGF